MIENQSILKIGRTDHEPGHDMLSDLPLSIIHIILALVPIRDAVKTSILSRQWRYTWATLPHLVFEEQCPSEERYKSRPKFDDCMKNFITHALLLHKGPIQKFKLSVSFTRNCQSIGIWLLCLSRNDIRELIIDSPHWKQPFWTQELHSSIYSCKKLTRLELRKCKLNPPPSTFKAFLFLRCLFLRQVDLSTNEVESLVASCPLLEEFTSIDCGSSELRISTPNLKVLHLHDDNCNKLSVYAPLLAELLVEMEDYDNLDDGSVCNCANFMSGFTEYLSRGVQSCHHTLVFPRLKYIELNDMRFEHVNVISAVARLIASAPNLQKLEIPSITLPDTYYSDQESEDDDDDDAEAPHVSFSEFGCAPHVKLEKLRVVKIIYVTDLPLLMALIKFLLERTPVLESMSFIGLTSMEKRNLSAELQGCNRASPNAMLVMTN